MEDIRLKELIETELAAFTAADPGNVIAPEAALEPEAQGLHMFDAPLIGVAAADDPLFEELRRPEAVGPQMRLPEDWLEGARSVVSYFFPMSEQVRTSNRSDGHASPEWFHARIDGQAFILKAGAMLVELLKAQGWNAICPAASPEMAPIFLDDADPAHSFTSNWSERHVAYAAGLGTFSLSKGLITERGMAGRFGSVVTDAPLPATERPYSSFDEYCILCGACIARCPVGAISLESGKDHFRCYEEMTASKRYYPGYLGCGKCQTGVPCEYQRPKRQ